MELSIDGGELKLYRERFLMCFFSISVFANQMLWVTFVPISDLSEEWLGVSTLEVNLLTIIWMILYLPGTILGVEEIGTSKDCCNFRGFVTICGSDCVLLVPICEPRRMG